MFARPIILFLVALCLFQILHGGVTRRLVPRSTDEEETSENLLEDFERLLNKTQALREMMQTLNSSLRSFGSSVDHMGTIISDALANATRTLNETSNPL